MTQLTAGANYPIDTTSFNVSALLSGSVSDAGDSGFRVQLDADYRETYTGSNLTFDSGGGLATGTLTGLQETFNGEATFTMTAFNIDAAAFVQWVHDANSSNTTTSAAANATATAAFFGGDDTLQGSAYSDLLDGFGGNNVLFGGDGGDTLIGGAGNDHLYGQSPNGGSDGADSLNGGAGMDYLQGNAGNDTIQGGNGPDRVNGGANDDLINGGNDADYVNGNRGNDTIDGGEGNDTLRGGQDQDSISGSQGNDSLSGDLGDDTLIGGTGFDTLTGAAGADRFQFAGGDASFGAGSGFQTDMVADYTDGTDKIGLAFSVNAVLTGNDQSNVSSAATYAQQLLDNHGGNGEVAALRIGSDTYLFYSASGGATVDSAIKVAGMAPGVFDTTDFL